MKELRVHVTGCKDNAVSVGQCHLAGHALAVAYDLRAAQCAQRDGVPGSRDRRMLRGDAQATKGDGGRGLAVPATLGCSPDGGGALRDHVLHQTTQLRVFVDVS